MSASRAGNFAAFAHKKRTVLAPPLRGGQAHQDLRRYFGFQGANRARALGQPVLFFRLRPSRWDPKRGERSEFRTTWELAKLTQTPGSQPPARRELNA